MIELSIIIPIYNAEKYIQRCIESVINQTLLNWELLLIDDGSTDNSRKICDKYAQSDKRIRVIHKKNGGVSSARNLGIDIAIGEYITFIDSDDWIEKNFLKKAIEYIQNKNISILITGFVFDNDKGTFNIFSGKNDEIFSKEQAQIEFFKQNKFAWTVYDKFYKKDVIKKFRFKTKFKIGEDMLFFWEILNSVEKIGYLPLYQYHYDISASKTMTSNFSMKWFDGIRVKRKIYREIKNSSKELSLLSKITCIVEMMMLAKKAINTSNYNTKRLVVLLQKNIRKNIYIIFLYPRSNIITFRQRLGLVYFSFPYKCCRLINKILINKNYEVKN